MELIELKENVALKEQIGNCDPATFWGKIVPAADFPILIKMALHILTMFGSTYCCKLAFSTMNIIQMKYRTRLSNEHLHQCLLIALKSFVPKLKILAGEKKVIFHIRH